MSEEIDDDTKRMIVERPEVLDQITQNVYASRNDVTESTAGEHWAAMDESTRERWRGEALAALDDWFAQPESVRKARDRAFRGRWLSRRINGLPPAPAPPEGR